MAWKKEYGRDTAFTKLIQARIPHRMYKHLCELAEAEGTTQTAIIVEAIERELKRRMECDELPPARGNVERHNDYPVKVVQRYREIDAATGEVFKETESVSYEQRVKRRAKNRATEEGGRED